MGGWQLRSVGGVRAVGGVGLWRSLGGVRAICGLGGGSFTATSDVSAVKPADGGFVHTGDKQEHGLKWASLHGGKSPTRTSG
ncbi:hypothetical protein ES703_28190 [subsurface metagenome]